MEFQPESQRLMGDIAEREKMSEGSAATDITVVWTEKGKRYIEKRRSE